MKAQRGHPNLLTPYPKSFPGYLRWWPFPSLRKHQTKVLRLIEKEDRLMIQAPTGFGKSILVMAALWYRLVEGHHQLYLFAKTKAQLRTVFLKNIKRYFSHPPADTLTIVPLIARDDLCSDPSRGGVCRGCSARGKARYIEAGRLTSLLHTLNLGSCPDSFPGFRDVLAPFGCPYELIRRMVPQANIILLTHGYLETRFLRDILVKILRKAEDYGFRSGNNRDVVIDEAHNFGSCIEAHLSRDQLVRAFEITPVPLIEKLVSLLSLPLGRVERPRGTFVDDLSQLTHFLAQKRNRRVFPVKDYDAIQAVKTFVEREGQHWVLNEQGLVQLDPWPSPIFELLFLHFKQILLLSGTFFKIQWYNYYFTYQLQEKGLTGRTFTMINVPPAVDRRRQLFIGALYHRGVSSKPEHRVPEFYEWAADIIHEASLLAHDHTFVFVPSYDELEKFYPLLCTRLKTQLSVYREPAKGRIPFLSELIQGPPSVVIGVYGGKLTEGIEIRHPETGRSRTRLLILVGLPYPPPTPEHMLLNQIYQQRRFGKPFAQWALINRLLYTKVHQALGRAIRSEQDLAAALILDYRAVTKLRFHLPGMHVYRSRDRLITALMLALRNAR